MADRQAADQAFDTLEVPLHQLGLGRYRLPLFAAPYYEIEFPHTGAPTGPRPAKLTIRFHEGGADAFRHALAHARAAWEQRRHEIDSLRTFAEGSRSTV